MALNPPLLLPRPWDFCPPFFRGAPAAAWRSLAIGAVDEDELHVGVSDKCVAHPPPDAPTRPSGEALIDTVPDAELGRERPPRHSGTRHPHHGFDEAPAILFVPNPYVGAIPQKGENLWPLVWRYFPVWHASIIQVNSLCQHPLAFWQTLIRYYHTQARRDMPDKARWRPGNPPTYLGNLRHSPGQSRLNSRRRNPRHERLFVNHGRGGARIGAKRETPG